MSQGNRFRNLTDADLQGQTQFVLVDARQDAGVAWADDDEGLAREVDVFRPYEMVGT